MAPNEKRVFHEKVECDLDKSIQISLFDTHVKVRGSMQDHFPIGTLARGATRNSIFPKTSRREVLLWQENIFLLQQENLLLLQPQITLRTEFRNVFLKNLIWGLRSRAENESIDTNFSRRIHWCAYHLVKPSRLAKCCPNVLPETSSNNMSKIRTYLTSESCETAFLPATRAENKTIPLIWLWEIDCN